jgi:predicted nucleic acid-binding protein
MDRLFLDSSILYSAAQENCGLSRLWHLAEQGKCLLFASRYVIEKARVNLQTLQKKGLETCLCAVKVVLEIDPRLQCPIRLPRDAQVVFMAAIFSRANYLLTGDNESFGKYFGQTLVGVKISIARDYLQGLQP